MKRIVAAVVILILVISVCVWELCFLGSTVDDFKAEIDNVKAFYSENKTEVAINKTNEIIENWKEKHSIISTFIDHKILRDIETSFETMQVALENDDVEDFSVECKKASLQLDDLNMSELPLISNIL